MESYIPEFKDGKTKNSEIVITIDGPSGAGKGTMASYIAERLGLPNYSAGDFFRKLAKKKGMTVEELSENADLETDKKVDEHVLENGLNNSCIIESRISSWVMGDHSDLRIYVTADLDERARRVFNDLDRGERVAEEKDGSDLEEVKKRIKKRDEDNRRRYQDYYGIDTENLEIYDMIIDNTEMTIEEQKEMIDKVLEKEFEERLG
ncbi:MAG: (d)CMP kinase [Candidatus Nanohaloarchaea archaeon]